MSAVSVNAMSAARLAGHVLVIVIVSAVVARAVALSAIRAWATRHDEEANALRRVLRAVAVK